MSVFVCVCVCERELVCLCVGGPVLARTRTCVSAYVRVRLCPETSVFVRLPLCWASSGYNLAKSRRKKRDLTPAINILIMNFKTKQ